MTKIDTSTEAVEALLKDVTPGPWEVEYKCGTTRLMMGGDCQMCDETYYPWVPENLNDWELFAASRQLVPALLAERDQLRDELDAAYAIIAAERGDVIKLRAALSKKDQANDQ